MEPNERSKPNRSKRYSQAFKAQVLAESNLPWALIREVALKPVGCANGTQIGGDV